MSGWCRQGDHTFTCPSENPLVPATGSRPSGGRYPGPLLTQKVHDALLTAARVRATSVACSLDLDRTTTPVEISPDGWSWQGQHYPYLANCKDRTIYYWTGEAFGPVSQYLGKRRLETTRGDDARLIQHCVERPAAKREQSKTRHKLLLIQAGLEFVGRQGARNCRHPHGVTSA